MHGSILLALALYAVQGARGLIVIGGQQDDKCSALARCATGFKCDFIASGLTTIPAGNGVNFVREPGEGICKGKSGTECVSSDNCQNGFSCTNAKCTAPTNSNGNDGCESDSDCAFDRFCTMAVECNPNSGGMTGANREQISTKCCKTKTNGGCNVDKDCGEFGSCSTGYSTIAAWQAAGSPSGGICKCPELKSCSDGSCKEMCPTGGLSGNLRRRRALAQQILAQDPFSRQHCPLGLTACPIPGAAGYECLDTDSELENCGACSISNPFSSANATGVNCLTLPGAGAVTCSSGKCEVYSCKAGFRLQTLLNGLSSCVEKKQRRNTLQLTALSL